MAAWLSSVSIKDNEVERKQTANSICIWADTSVQSKFKDTYHKQNLLQTSWFLLLLVWTYVSLQHQFVFILALDMGYIFVTGWSWAWRPCSVQNAALNNQNLELIPSFSPSLCFLLRCWKSRLKPLIQPRICLSERISVSEGRGREMEICLCRVEGGGRWGCDGK